MSIYFQESDVRTDVAKWAEVSSGLSLKDYHKEYLGEWDDKEDVAQSCLLEGIISGSIEQVVILVDRYNDIAELMEVIRRGFSKEGIDYKMVNRTTFTCLAKRVLFVAMHDLKRLRGHGRYAVVDMRYEATCPHYKKYQWGYPLVEAKK